MKVGLKPNLRRMKLACPRLANGYAPKYAACKPEDRALVMFICTWKCLLRVSMRLSVLANCIAVLCNEAHRHAVTAYP